MFFETIFDTGVFFESFFFFLKKCKKGKIELYMCDYVMRDDIARHYYTTTVIPPLSTVLAFNTFGVNYCYEYDEGGGSSRRRRRRFAATSFIFVGEEGAERFVERRDTEEFVSPVRDATKKIGQHEGFQRYRSEGEEQTHGNHGVLP